MNEASLTNNPVFSAAKGFQVYGAWNQISSRATWTSRSLSAILESLVENGKLIVNLELQL